MGRRVYNHPHAEAGWCVGHVEPDGRIYNHPYANAGYCIGHIAADGRVYNHPNAQAGYCIGHIAADGRVYNHPNAQAGYCIGHIAADGRVYNHPNAQAGYCVGHVEGGYSPAGAAALLLFHLPPVPEEKPEPKIKAAAPSISAGTGFFGEFLIFLPLLIAVCLIVMLWKTLFMMPGLAFALILAAVTGSTVSAHRKRGDLSTNPSAVAAAKRSAVSWALLLTAIPAVITLISIAATYFNVLFLLFLPVDYICFYQIIRNRMLCGKMEARPLFGGKTGRSAQPPAYTRPPTYTQPPAPHTPPVPHNTAPRPASPVSGKPHHTDGTSNYFICLRCGATLRVPAGKGKIQLTCPKCRYQFIVND